MTEEKLAFLIAQHSPAMIPLSQDVDCPTCGRTWPCEVFSLIVECYRLRAQLGKRKWL